MRGMQLILFYLAAGGSRPKGSRGSGRNKSGGSRSTSTVSNTELSQLSEELLTLDTGITQPTLRQQGRTSPKATRDSALNPYDIVTVEA